MRRRSKLPHKRKFFHTSKKFDKRDSTTTKNKIHTTRKHKEDNVKDQIRPWKYRRIQKR